MNLQIISFTFLEQVNFSRLLSAELIVYEVHYVIVSTEVVFVNTAIVVK